MLVDKILEYYGHHPAYYQSMDEKWSRALVEIFNTAFPILTIILTSTPWIFYFLQRKKHNKDHKHFLWTIIKFSIAGLLLGLFLPTLVIWITGAFAIRALYGG